MKRYLSSPFFLIAILCFFLPFFAITCGSGGIPGLGGGGGGIPDLGGQGGSGELATVTGVELITGGAEENLSDTNEFQPDLGPLGGPTPLPGVSPAADESAPTDLGMSQIWAISAALVALLGIFLSLLAGRAGGIMALALGVVGVILMLLLSSAMKGAIGDALGGEQAAAFIKVEPKIGYLLTLGAFAIAAVTGLIRLMMPDRPVEAAPAGFEQPPPGSPPPPPPAAAPPA